MSCPRGCPTLPYVITDYGAGTGDYCPTCGTSLSRLQPPPADKSWIEMEKIRDAPPSPVLILFGGFVLIMAIFALWTLT